MLHSSRGLRTRSSNEGTNIKLPARIGILLLSPLPCVTYHRWAQDDYNATQRTVDTWTFFVRFRTSLYLLDKKWSYVGGWSEEAKVCWAGGVRRPTCVGRRLVTRWEHM